MTVTAIAEGSQMFKWKHLLRLNVIGLLFAGAVAVSLVGSPHIRKIAASMVGSNAAATSSSTNGTGPGTFALTGVSTQTLRPGLSSPVKLSLANTYNYDLLVSGITVSKSLTTGDRDCPPQYFTTVPYSGPASLTVPSGRTLSLSDLKVPSANWPQVTMIPGAPNACQGVGFSLGYSATAAKK